MELNQVREELEESVKNQEFQRAAELKEALHKLEMERSTLLASAQPSVEEVRTEKVGLAQPSVEEVETKDGQPLCFSEPFCRWLTLPWRDRVIGSCCSGPSHETW